MSLVLGSKNVATAGSAVPLSSTSLRVAQIVIQVKPTNSGYIYLGDNTVTSSNGIRLEVPVAGVVLPDAEIKLTGVGNNLDLSQLYINASQSGDGVNFLYEVF
jgi:hypothetical protein